MSLDNSQAKLTQSRIIDSFPNADKRLFRYYKHQYLTIVEIESISFSKNGLNDSNQVAFRVRFTDGGSGIFRADPIPNKKVPESSSILGLTSFFILGIGSTLKRKPKLSESTEKEITKAG